VLFYRLLRLSFSIIEKSNKNTLIARLLKREEVLLKIRYRFDAYYNCRDFGIICYGRSMGALHLNNIRAYLHIAIGIHKVLQTNHMIFKINDSMSRILNEFKTLLNPI
jgi:hypothetical protein